VSGCRMMSGNALTDGDFRGISSGRVGLSRMMLGWVGVKSGVKRRSQIGGFQYPWTCVGTVPPGAVMATVRFERTQFLPQ
jgi:hypothetical protein